MRACDIKHGGVYRLKLSPSYGYVKVLCVLKPKQTLFYKDFDGATCVATNPHKFIAVKAVHSCNDDFAFGLIKYFVPRELIQLEQRLVQPITQPQGDKE